jgi:hypothetical protein
MDTSMPDQPDALREAVVRLRAKTKAYYEADAGDINADVALALDALEASVTREAELRATIYNPGPKIEPGQFREQGSQAVQMRPGDAERGKEARDG